MAKRDEGAARAALVRDDGRAHGAARAVPGVPGAPVPAGAGDPRGARAGGLRAAPKLVTIDVVVNVVYKTDAQNISDAQINSQIAALNKDFAATNPDRAKVPAPWTGPGHRLAHPVQAREGRAAQDDEGRLHHRRRGEEAVDGRRSRRFSRRRT